MKQYEVIIQNEAIFDIEEYKAFIARDSSERALKWKLEILELIESLNQIPRRFQLSFEPEIDSHEIRAVAFHSHLIIYEVKDEVNLVLVLRVWPAQMRPPKPVHLSLE